MLPELCLHAPLRGVPAFHLALFFAGLFCGLVARSVVCHFSTDRHGATCRHSRLLLALPGACLFLFLSFMSASLCMLLATLLLLSFLLALSLIDLHCYLLPDCLTLPLLWLGLLSHALLLPNQLTEAVYGAAAGYGCCWIIYWLCKAITAKEGLGYGDFKLMAALGAWVGWQQLPQVAIIASFIGGVAYCLRLGLYKKRGELPFGPCLATGGALVYISQHFTLPG
ncbi:MAG: A24 family peptidase [Rouxiella aceris]|uniref:prepilin peptidase n=1 Tax=Rouxiella aceris TaxID=2703884 RepID=UPI00284264F1|nr:A24 family peptidase [Rouxiella aceris]MDR3434251.1 A24 family peptidase [Rouxiella aceris]